MAKYKQGFFKPLNPQKYKGNSTEIIYRSSWELRVMNRFDTDPNVIWWSSETVKIPYVSPIDNRVHRYFMDFIVNINTTNNNNKTLLIEVKPKAQTVAPKKPVKLTKSYKNAVMTFGVNSAKWLAAEQFSKKHNYDFKILTEDEIYGI